MRAWWGDRWLPIAILHEDYCKVLCNALYSSRLSLSPLFCSILNPLACAFLQPHSSYDAFSVAFVMLFIAFFCACVLVLSPFRFLPFSCLRVPLLFCYISVSLVYFCALQVLSPLTDCRLMSFLVQLCFICIFYLTCSPILVFSCISLSLFSCLPFTFLGYHF